MSFQITKSTGLLAAFSFAICAPLARADFTTSYQVSPSSMATQCDVVASTSPNVPFIICGLIASQGVSIDTIQASGSQKSGEAWQFGDGLEVQNTSKTKSEAVSIWFAGTDFTAPTSSTGLDYASSLALFSTAGSGTAVLESCIDKSNGKAPPSGKFCSSPADTITTKESYGPTDRTTGRTTTEAIGPLTKTPYSLSQEVSLLLGPESNVDFVALQTLSTDPVHNSLRLDGNFQPSWGFGSELDFFSNHTFTNGPISNQPFDPTPEPASLILLGTALIGVFMLVRRKTKSQGA
jgi:hypothetical protein